MFLLEILMFVISVIFFYILYLYSGLIVMISHYSNQNGLKVIHSLLQGERTLIEFFSNKKNYVGIFIKMMEMHYPTKAFAINYSKDSTKGVVFIVDPELVSEILSIESANFIRSDIFTPIAEKTNIFNLHQPKAHNLRINISKYFSTLLSQTKFSVLYFQLNSLIKTQIYVMKERQKNTQFFDKEVTSIITDSVAAYFS